MASETNTVKVILQPHPFGPARAESAAAAGTTVEDIARAVQPDDAVRAQMQAFVGGHLVPRAHWARVRPRAGVEVFLRIVPAGGGGARKNPMRIVVALALSALSPIVAGASGVFGGKAVAMGLGFVSKLLLSALSPPGRARFVGPKESPTLFLQGARNGVSPFGRVPRPLGTHRMVPPLGAHPYTETEGGAQYLRMLFVWGYGPLEISDLKIGETPLADFEGVETETRQGYPDDTPIGLYSDSVLQNDLQVSLTNAGGFSVRTSDADADEISVDITFPQGLFYLAASGAKGALSVQVTVGYSPAGADDWTDETFTWTAAQGAALRQSVRFAVAQGQYDVRVRRDTADATADNVFDATVWTALRTVRHTAPVTMPGLAMTAVRIRATDQLHGVLDRFNGVVSSILPDWDGEEWTGRVTSNPASLYRHVLQGGANARPLPDARIDIARLEAWHAACAAAGREYNAVIDSDISVRDLMQDIAAAGRAAPALVDGLWSVAEDKPQTVPVQHFTPRNTWGFKGEKSFDAAPHALRVRFVNRDKGWFQDEVLAFDDGYDAENATQYDVLALPGITSAEQAWRDARYHIAAARLRPENYSFYADVEHIVCTRGDLVRFTHDVPLFGLAAARVKAVEVADGAALGVTLDTDILMEEGKNYAIRFRRAEGESLVMPLVTAAGTGNVFTFSAPCAEEEGPEAGDLALFGESGMESVELVVRSIEPGGDLSARITCVDAAPAVHAADAGPIPAFSAQITVPPEMQRPPAPVVAGTATADGALFITLSPPEFPLPLGLSMKARLPEETDFHAVEGRADGGDAVISGLTPGLRYDVSLVYRNISGVASAATILPNVLIAGVGGVPPDVSNLSIDIVGGTAHLRWDAAPGADIDYYRIRFNNAVTGATWASSLEVVSGVSRAATTVAVPAQVGTWLVKAVNTAGNESLNAATAISTIDRIEGYSVEAAADETPLFSGAMTPGSSGVAFTGDERLVLDGALSGTYVFGNAVDLGGVYPCLLSAALDVVGVNEDNLLDDWNGVDLLEDWDGAEDPSTWGAQLQLRRTNDDPAGTPAWSAWCNFTVGTWTARAFEFRLLLSSAVSGVTPSVADLRVDLSMSAWAQGEGGITSAYDDADAGGGTRVAFPDDFYDLTALAVTPHDMGTGDYYVTSGADETGFNISFYNASDTRITRGFDYIAQGIGRKASS